jgi:hypothetical protein
MSLVPGGRRSENIAPLPLIDISENTNISISLFSCVKLGKSMDPAGVTIPGVSF